MHNRDVFDYDFLWKKCRKGALSYINSLAEDKPWILPVSKTANQPIAIASATAMLILSFLEALDDIPSNVKNEWLKYLQSFQKEDGLFEDEIDMAEETQGYPRWALRAHRSRHIAWAIESLNGKLKYPIEFVEPFTKKGEIEKWLENLWVENIDRIWAMSNWIMDMGVLLDLQHRHFGDKKAAAAVEVILTFLDAKQDCNTGYWFKNGTDLRCAMAGAMHFYPLYWAYGHKLSYFEKVVETTLSLQQPDGLFGFESGKGGCQCLDYDAMLILINGCFKLGNHRKEISSACKKVINEIMIDQLPDGSFCDSQVDEIRHWTTKAAVYNAKAGSLWDTYARLMTIAMCIEILTHQPPKPMQSEHHLFEIFHFGYGWSKGVRQI